MDLILIFIAIIAIIAIIAMIKYYTNPDIRKSVDILHEYREKEKKGEIIFSNKDGYINSDVYNNYNDDGYITSQDIENILLDLDEYSDGDDYIELPIRGINFRGLGSSNIGYFEGYITTDKCNKYDKFAIAIYGNDGTHFGFIEKGQEFLYNKIEEVGGIINVSIEVHPFTNDLAQNKLSGTITIDKEILK